MVRAALLIRDLLSPQDRRRLLRLVPLMAISSLVDLAIVAGSGTFFGLLARPQLLHGDGAPAAAFAWSGAASDAEFLSMLGVSVLVVVVTGNSFSAWTSRQVLRFAWGQVESIGERTLAGYLNRPYVFFLSRTTHDLSQRLLVDLHNLVDKVIVQMAQVFSRTAGAVLIVAWLVAQQPWLTLVLALVLGSGYSALLVALRKRIFQLGKTRSDAGHDRIRITNESLVGVKELKVLGLEDEAVRRYRGPTHTFARAMSGQAILSSIPRYALEGVAVGGMVIIIIYLLWTYRSTEGALALAGTYAVAAYRLLPTATSLFALASNVRFELHAIEKIHQDVTSAPFASRPTPSEVAFEREIELSGVTFRYPGATRPLFEGLDLRLAKGTWTALVGSTGSGKTTLADLLMGLLEPEAGELRVDGRALHGAADLLGWQRHIGYVPQSIFLGDESVGWNIAFGDLPMDRARIADVARTAVIYDFVERELDNAFDTPVGERGIRLSGGQRQRIGIARALYRRPELLVLDEATSALDNETEALVMQRLRAEHRSTTVVMIAHRLSTTRYCDEILLLELGRVADRGSYDELMARNERFRELVRSAEQGPHRVESQPDGAR